MCFKANVNINRPRYAHGLDPIFFMTGERNRIFIGHATIYVIIQNIQDSI
jgi:hypothetical protein